MQTEFVMMVHPNLPGQQYKAPRQGVRQMQRSGWQLAPEPPPAAPKPTETPALSGVSSSQDTDQPPLRRRAKEKE